MALNDQRPLLLTTAYNSEVDGRNCLDLIFQRFTVPNHFNEFTARAILDDLTSNDQTADRNLLCQFIVDMIHEDSPNADTLSTVNYHLLYTFVNDVLLHRDLGIRDTLPYSMRHQINELLIRYRNQTAIVREHFIERYLNVQPENPTLVENHRNFLPENPIVIWLNEEMDRDMRVDTPQRCLRRAYCYRKLTSILWTLDNFFNHIVQFVNPEQFRQMVRRDSEFRNLRLDYPMTLRNGPTVSTLGALLDYLVYNDLDRPVQLRVCQLTDIDRYRLELLYLGDLNEIIVA